MTFHADAFVFEASPGFYPLDTGVPPHVTSASSGCRLATAKASATCACAMRCTARPMRRS